MKKKTLLYLAIASALVATGCEFDNFEEPKSQLTGKVIYQDNPIGLRSNGVQLELWEHGHELFTKIPVFLDQEGNFSAMLFDGNYKMVLLRGNGPWVDNTDSIDVVVKGATTVNMPVTPYFVIENPSFERSGQTINATCNIKHVNTTRALENVTLFLGYTNIVDHGTFAERTEKTDVVDLSAPVTISVGIPNTLQGRNYIYARIGVRTVGTSEMIYSPVQKILVN